MTDVERKLLDATLGLARSALEIASSAVMVLASDKPNLIPAFLESLDDAIRRTEEEVGRSAEVAAGLSLAMERIRGIENSLRELQTLRAARNAPGSPLP